MKEWVTAKLGDVLTRAERFEERDEWTEYPFAGTYSFARGIFVGERKMGSTFKLPKVQRIKVGDFVYCKIMAWEGAFGLVPDKADDCVMSGAFVAYEIDTTRLEPRFLDLYFKIPKNWKGLGGQSSGTNVRRQSLHPNQFEAHEIPLPPLAEQRRIVARIEALAAQIDEAKRLRKEAVDEAEAMQGSAIAQQLSHRKSSAKVLLPPPTQSVRRGVEIPKKVNAVAAKWQVPEGWLQVSVAELLLTGALVDLKDGNHGANHPRSAEFVGNGTPFLMASDIQRGAVLWDEASKLGAGTLGRLRVGFSEEGDVLFTHKASIGKTAVADRPSVLSPQVAYYRCNRDFIDPGWLVRFLASPLFLSQLAEVQGQSTRDFVSISKQYDQFVMLPPLPEQRRIVAELDALQAEVDGLKRLQAETAAELDALLPAILDRAFKGEL